MKSSLRKRTPEQIEEPMRVITVRIPVSEYERVKQAAKLAFISMNWFAANAIANAADAEISKAIHEI